MMRFNGRRAGGVLRYHTYPVLQRQTVADHSWHVMRIYMELWGAPEPHITAWLLHHDSAEHIVGDVPFGAKETIPEIGTRLAIAEEKIIMEAVPSCQRLLEDWEKWRLKACDLLEMVDFGWEEHRLGNTYGEAIWVNAGRALIALCETTPNKVTPQDTKRVIEKTKEMKNG